MSRRVPVSVTPPRLVATLTPMPPRRAPAAPPPAHSEPPSLRALLIAAREAAGLSQRLLARRIAEQRGGELERWRRIITRYEVSRGAGGPPQEPTLETATAVAEALGLRLEVSLRRIPATP